MTPDVPNREVIELLMKLADLARNLREIGKEVDRTVDEALGGPTVNDNVSLVVVCNLVVSGPLRPTDIAEFSGLTSGGVTKVVTRLEDAGMVKRSYGVFPEDRRGVSIELTEKGRAFADAYAELLAAKIAERPELSEPIRRFLDTD